MPSATTKTSRNAVDSTLPAKPRAQDSERFVSCGNVYADLGLHNPENLKRKSKLMMQLMKEIRRLKLLLSEFAERMGLPVEKAARMRHGHFDAIAERRMKECLEKMSNEK
jgi:predicted XRE-type DNA-binding protein